MVLFQGVTDKEWYTNSYHVYAQQKKFSAFDKIDFEADFQGIFKWWCISYIEIPNFLKIILKL